MNENLINENLVEEEALNDVSGGRIVIRTWVRYQIQPGDYLGKIAIEHNTTVSALMEKNPHIKNPNFIVAGQYMLVPIVSYR